MRIEALLGSYAPDALRPGELRSRGRSEGQAPSKKGDRVEISEEGRKKLERVRERIARGYYDSEAVAEDISDKLSGVIESLR